MTINEMRNYISDEYPESVGWHRKVSKMPTNQVIAIYHKFVKHHANEERKKRQEQQFHQMDMFEYMTMLAIENGWKGSHTEIEV